MVQRPSDSRGRYDCSPRLPQWPWRVAGTRTTVSRHHDASARQKSRGDPNPTLRLQVIEGWAQQARRDDGLDLLTNALDWLDEMVRAWVQELVEEDLARR